MTSYMLNKRQCPPQPPKMSLIIVLYEDLFLIIFKCFE